MYLSSVYGGVPSGSLQAKLRVRFSIIMPSGSLQAKLRVRFSIIMPIATDCVSLARAVYVCDPLVVTI